MQINKKHSTIDINQVLGNNRKKDPTKFINKDDHLLI